MSIVCTYTPQLAERSAGVLRCLVVIYEAYECFFYLLMERILRAKLRLFSKRQEKISQFGTSMISRDC